MKNFGFTLAEVLVTLGIIGVVSSMTLPTLIQNHQKKTYVTQLHKVYNELQQVFLQYRTDKNAISLTEAGLTAQTEANNLLTNYFKSVTVCDNLEPPCIPNTEYKNLNGGTVENVANWWSTVKCGVLSSGASICIESLAAHSTNNVRWGHILVDTNGMKGPNIGGRDVFFLAYFDNGTIDEECVVPTCNSLKVCTLPSNANDTRETYFNSNCKSSTRFQGCFGKILNDNWEMNY